MREHTAITTEPGAMGTVKYSLSRPLVWLVINLEKKLETSRRQGTSQQRCVKLSRGHTLQGTQNQCVGLTLASSPYCSFNALSLLFWLPFPGHAPGCLNATLQTQLQQGSEKRCYDLACPQNLELHCPATRIAPLLSTELETNVSPPPTFYSSGRHAWCHEQREVMGTEEWKRSSWDVGVTRGGHRLNTKA